MFTLEINHSTFAEPARVVAGVSDDQMLLLEADAPLNPGETVLFIATPFNTTWPEAAEKKPPSTTITIDNVARELAPKIEAAIGYRENLIVRYREYRSDMAGPVYGPIEFTLRGVTMVGATLSGIAEVASLSTKKFPGRTYNINEFPSMLP